MQKNFLAALLFLVLLGYASAATYYLDAVNGNDANPGTSSQPWKTVARAMTQYTGAGTKVVSGDTVKIRDGNYAGYVTGYGGEVNHTDWITYEADTGCNPVFAYIESRGGWQEERRNAYLRFRGITVDVLNSGSTAIYCRDVDYLQFYNMNIIGAGYTHPDESRGFLLWSTSHVIVDHCNIYGDGPGIGEGISSGGISYEGFGKGFDVGIDAGANPYATDVDVDVTITNCNIQSCGTAIGLSGSKWNVSNNKIHHMTWDGIVLQQINGPGLTDPVMIANNEIHTLIEYEGAHNDGIQFSGYGAMNHVIIRGNIIHHMDGDAMFFKGDITGLHNTDWLVENNLVYDTMRGQYLSTGYHLNWAVRLFNCDNAVFRNNTIDGTVTGGIEGTPPTKMTFSVFSNNIIQNLALFTTPPNTETIVEYENNNIIRSAPYGAMVGFVWGPNTVILSTDSQYEALFRDFDANDFSLAPGSIAINAADPQYAPATDILGNPRAGTPDIGAYEFQGTTQQCSGTDVSCGVYPNCVNCNSLDGCNGNGYRNYYCSGTSCTYTEDNCSDCSCSCNGYNQTESIANNNCSDGKDNDCDGTTDAVDSGCQPASVPADYVGYWRFDASLLDETGSNNAVFQGGTPNYVAGKIGQALQLDSVDDFAKTANNNFSNNTFSKGITITMWIKAPLPTKDAQITSIEGAYYLGVSDTGNYTFHIDGQAESNRSTTKPNNVWQFIAGTADKNGNTKLYVNGTVEKTASQNYYNIDSLDRPTAIGNHPTTSLLFNGSIDELRIYNRALSNSEITAIYNYTGTQCTTTQLLEYIAQWKQGNITMPTLMQKIAAWKAGTGC